MRNELDPYVRRMVTGNEMWVTTTLVEKRLPRQRVVRMSWLSFFSPRQGLLRRQHRKIIIEMAKNNRPKRCIFESDDSIYVKFNRNTTNPLNEDTGHSNIVYLAYQ